MEPESKLLIPDAVRRELRAVPAGPVTPLTLLHTALTQGAGPEQLDKILGLVERYEANVARKAFAKALSAFHVDPPDILKNRIADRGNAGKYPYPTHDEVTFKVSEALAKHGLCHTWSYRQENGLVYVTCRLMHEEGHYVETTLAGPPDTSGSKTPAQAIASVRTFFERYTLLGVTGLSSRQVGDEDDDANGRAARETQTGVGLQQPPPEGYRDFQSVMEETAKLGMIALQDKWKQSARVYKDYTAKCQPEWWGHVKRTANDAPPQGDASIPQ
jgi:hypothetical protein